MVGCLQNVVAHKIEKPSDFESWSADETHKSGRERTMRSVSVKRHLVILCCKCDKCKRLAKAVQPRGLKFQGMSASMSLLGQRLAIRSRVSLAQA